MLYLIFTAQSNFPALVVKQNTEATSEGMPIIGLNSNSTKDSVRSAVPHPAIVAPRGHQNGTTDVNKSTKQVQRLLFHESYVKTTDLVLFLLLNFTCKAIFAWLDRNVFL